MSKPLLTESPLGLLVRKKGDEDTPVTPEMVRELSEDAPPAEIGEKMREGQGS